MLQATDGFIYNEAKTAIAALITKGLSGQLIDSPVPVPGSHEVLVRVVATALNPKDWKNVEVLGQTGNSGDDMAGFVEAVGDKVFEFKPGDRVAALHRTWEPHGTFAEYSIAPDYAVFRLKDTTTFEEAAAIPVAAMTAGLALFQRLGLPELWVRREKPQKKTPLLIYGAGTVVGLYTVQLAKQAGIHPVIAIAGRSKEYVQTLIDPGSGDTVLDYRDGLDNVLEQARTVLGGESLYHALDCVAGNGSDNFIAGLINSDGSGKAQVVVVLPRSSDAAAMNLPSSVGLDPLVAIPESVSVKWSNMPNIHSQESEFAFVFLRYLGRAVAQGRVKAIPQEVIPGGLDGIPAALRKLKAGANSASKYVTRIADTASVN
ncbi:related to zeta-crystallin / quinone reductase (NADPH) [Fusarium oxysporum]|uniref:Related to zeta-crystallin / quinone reductase (NADPH) n=1 Tax=Fusarium oxysporum TaxID=5507 RepID=A0A2H3U6M7_FUSOX|nr:related to zeta-crystallin / quinone reductase (NADPH) [Fusarium oxysporum]